MRIPNWVYERLESLYLTQLSIRHQESADQADRDDQALRSWAALAHEAHDSGMCGGAAAGCRFFPCYSVS